MMRMHDNGHTKRRITSFPQTALTSTQMIIRYHSMIMEMYYGVVTQFIAFFFRKRKIASFNMCTNRTSDNAYVESSSVLNSSVVMESESSSSSSSSSSGS